MTPAGRPRSFDPVSAAAAARDVFWQRGYRGTSMRDVGQETGILPGSLYHAFGDKEALFRRALEGYVVETTRAVETIVAEGPVLPRLREFLLAALRAADEHPGWGCLLGNTAVEVLPDGGDLAPVVRSGFRALEDGLARALTAAGDRGELRGGVVPADAAMMLLAVLQGLHVVARAESDPRRLGAGVDVALDGLRA